MDRLLNALRDAAPQVDFVGLRHMSTQSEHLSLRQGVVEPPHFDHDEGLMVTIHHKGASGYAATSDVSAQGIKRACEKALKWAELQAAHIELPLPQGRGQQGQYQTPIQQPWTSKSTAEKIELMMGISNRLKGDTRLVDYGVELYRIQSEVRLIDLEGGDIRQHFDMIIPDITATAASGSDSQTRTFGGMRSGRQGGLEVLEELGFHDAPERIKEQALELLLAPNCPEGAMDLILAPDQMILQIHESIGHPLELDRILGDERNYAGTSFVTLDMFGQYQYGSELLNISFDPSVQGQMASYAFDDEGTSAEKTMIIEKGLLKCPLGSASTQQRAQMNGVANSRATNWNRPPIDRMANLNLEPGTSSLDELIASVEQGVYMESNNSWSIDDSRNKFQFGCEYGRRIEKGELKEVIKNPNYRGISATFWRNLAGVANRESFEILGTPNCGKGEPNQSIHVGHATPAALFNQVEVFGGE